MRQNPQALAWTVLLLAFACFCVLATAIPLGIVWYTRSATTERTVDLEVIKGTVLLQRAGERAEVSFEGRQTIREGDAVHTTGDGQAILWLFDGSNVRLWPNSRVQLDRAQASRFSNELTEYSLTVADGHVRAEVAMLQSTSRRFRVQTPSTSIMLQDGTYSIDVAQVKGGALTEILCRTGSATVSGGGRTVEILHAERAIVEGQAAPQGPLPAARNLVDNGDFAQELSSGWVVDKRSEDKVIGDVSRSSDDGRDVARFVRGASNKHGEVALLQQLNRDVSDYDSLSLSFQVKLRDQSLSGGGWLGSEYPFMVRLTYRDINGNESQFVRGYFIQNRDGNPTSDGVQVPTDTWYVEGNIDLFEPRLLPERPAYLLRLELLASGWSFDSSVADVRLMAE